MTHAERISKKFTQWVSAPDEMRSTPVSAMARTDGNISGAARMLGISRPTLYDLLKQYQMQG